MKSWKEIKEIRRFLYGDEYKNGKVPYRELKPKKLNKFDLIDTKKFGFETLWYCEHCREKVMGWKCKSNEMECHICGEQMKKYEL